MDVTYQYVKDPCDPGTLHQQIAAAGLPISHVNTSPPDVYVIMTRDLDATEKTTLDGVVAGHVPPTPDARRRDLALAAYDDPDSPASLVELSGEYGLLDLINALQAKVGLNQTGRAQLRNSVRAIIKPGG